jgi:hypothetical protein
LIGDALQINEVGLVVVEEKPENKKPLAVVAIPKML